MAPWAFISENKDSFACIILISNTMLCSDEQGNVLLISIVYQETGTQLDPSYYQTAN
jgi:hypothetical protein